ncbi:MAG: hypothetical protein Q8P68_00005 [Candidatus Peregrinibacteria bacterium]|nr:hypothetical protein [Candidatus Peregrinibacteria bacterium]
MKKLENVILEEAVAYFQDEAERTELPPVFEKMRKIGADRDPRQFQVLVHPSYAFDKGWMEANLKKGLHSQTQILAWALKYFRLVMNSVINQPENTIITSDSSEVATGITEYHDKIVHTTGARSYLSTSELAEFLQLTKGINPKDSFRIHGSIWGRCPTGFATQLHIATKYDGYTGRCKGEGYLYNRGTRLAAQEDAYMYSSIKKSDAIRNGQISFGVQHNTALLGVANDDLFMDENSIIIPSPEEVEASKQ